MSSGPDSASTQAEPDSQRSRILSEAILLPLLGVFCYGLAFVYEAAYLRAFGIPLHLVQTNLDAVFVLIVAVGGVGWLIIWIVNLVAILWPSHPALRMKCVRIIVVLLVGLWPGLLYGFRLADGTLILVIASLLSG